MNTNLLNNCTNNPYIIIYLTVTTSTVCVFICHTIYSSMSCAISHLAEEGPGTEKLYNNCDHLKLKFTMDTCISLTTVQFLDVTYLQRPRILLNRPTIHQHPFKTI